MQRLRELRRHLTRDYGAEEALSSIATAAMAASGGAVAAHAHAHPPAHARKLRFTLDPPVGQPPVLTPAQREFYEENGYLVIRRLVTPAELERYRERFNLICEGKVDRPLGMTVMRDGTHSSSGSPARGIERWRAVLLRSNWQ